MVRPMSRAKWQILAELIRLPNQAGTLLLMLPALWALVLASQGHPPPLLLAIFAAGAFLMRSAGVIVNDLADRSLDRQVARTRNRPLASGALGVGEALAAAAVLVALAAGLLVWLNPLTVLLSPVALLLTALYPFTKRFLHIPQLMLGAAFGWGVVMAWADVRGTLDPPAWLLYGATICWAVAYDTIYALQDREDDRRIGVRSSAILFGARVWLAVGASLGVMLLLLVLAGRAMGAGAAYYGVLAAVGGFFSQQVRRLRSPVPPGLAFGMFKQHVWVGLAILLGVWLGFL
jgi:4-hydroxybenzoate polyprenyltransferase